MPTFYLSVLWNGPLADCLMVLRLSMTRVQAGADPVHVQTVHVPVLG